jgi:hypothetical protein
MMNNDMHGVERKTIAILKVLRDSTEPLGAARIATHLKQQGIDLGERAVRYHLKLLDEKGQTELVGRDGRIITNVGIEELASALVGDKVGFAISRIEQLAFRTNFDLEKRTGLVPVNISYFPRDRFGQALVHMKPAFEKGLCVSDLVATAAEGERFGDAIVPAGKVALATVCSIVINGCLLKAGVPADSRFGGILEIKEGKPLRFVELISYAGSSLDPSEVFIRARMTSVGEVARTGSGKILANYREIPGLCRPIVENMLAKLKDARMSGMLAMGIASEPVCEVSVDLNRIGAVLIGGLNPVAAAEEAGIEAESHAMSTVMDYQSLIKISDLV